MLRAAPAGIPATHAAATPIDRHALVSRHNPVLRAHDVDAPLTVGNGGFAFGCDITGLQTFTAQHYREGIPLDTLSRWCWVSDANPNHYTLADASRNFTEASGRIQPYATLSGTPAGDWLRKNPRTLPMGILSLEYDKPDGSALAPEDLKSPEQTLDLWSGVITSSYTIDGVPVKVTTACAADSDTLAVRIESALLARGSLRARLAFPRGNDLAVKLNPALDWSQPETHSSELSSPSMIVRSIGTTRYHVSTTARFTPTAPHHFLLGPEKGQAVFEFTLRFSPAAPAEPPAPVAAVLASSRAGWEKFWRSGAAIDFQGSTHPLAAKVEERIILSQYLMAVQMVGEVPPQETGLTCNTWYGKHHTEMIWWHAAHFALWGHDPLLARNLEWYQAQLPLARELARSRGLRGARWAKMVGNVMRESPGGPPLIVWNQPHLIYLCELLYRNDPRPETLARYRELVLETADCMASMLHFDVRRGQYVLGPPLWIAQEIHDQATSQNPGFELSYWRWTLRLAQEWRTRLGLPREAQWDHVLAHLPPLPQKDGLYVALESHPDTWDVATSRHDHPEMLMSLGFLPGGPDVDRDTMQRTLDAVLTRWEWAAKIWGWDYPMIAMTATRLGKPGVAMDILMRDAPNNRYMPNGHCPQQVGETTVALVGPRARKREIAVYLPANGAFLSAIALMVAGWDGCTEEMPGIPKDGSWTVRAEGLRRSP
jgi:hypothetical protein